MNIQIIQGEFNAKDTLELLTKMIQIKIRYHENKIMMNSSEEDIKARESKIKRLQNELFELRENIQLKDRNYILDGNISIE